jgi:hypothetical protein
MSDLFQPHSRRKGDLLPGMWLKIKDIHYTHSIERASRDIETF